jgi:putative membrane protein
MYDGGWMWNQGWGWGGWILMVLVMVMFWAMVITLVILAIRYFTSDRTSAGTTRPVPGPNRADDLLAERFARGEIDEEEFRRRMALLREHR